MSTNDRIWVIARSGDFTKVLDPLLKYPTLGGSTIANPTMKTSTTEAIPEGLDPFQYLTMVRHLDPLLLVYKKSDLDLKGLHRFGYVWVDLKKRTFTATFPKNPAGIYQTAYPTRRGFLMGEDHSGWPTHLTLPSGYDSTSRDVDVDGAMADMRRAWIGQDMLAASVAEIPISPPYARIADASLVNWKGMKRTVEDELYKSLETITKDRAGEVIDLLKDRCERSLNDDEYKWLVRSPGNYDRPVLWIPDKEPWTHLELYTLYRTVPSMIVTESERIPLCNPASEGFPPTCFRETIKRWLENHQIDRLYQAVQHMDKYLSEHVFVPNNAGMFISEFSVSRDVHLTWEES